MKKEIKRKYEDGGGIEPFSSSYALQPAQAKQANNIIKLNDSRKVSPTTGKPFSDKERKSMDVDSKIIEDIISNAKASGIDPLTALAVSYQETGFNQEGKGLYNLNPKVFGKPVGNAQEGMRSLQDQFKYAQNLQKRGVVPNDEAFLIQGNNGYGTIKRGHADLEGANRIYGLEIPESGIDFKKNPLYGKTVLSLRNEILGTNPQILDMIKKIPARKMALGGELENTDSLESVNTEGGGGTKSSTIPLPDYKDPKSRLAYAQAFRDKYGKDTLKGYGDIPLRVNEKPAWASDTSKNLAIKAAKAAGLDPALFYASSMIEGQSGLYPGADKRLAPNQVRSSGDKDFPVSGLWSFGLDSFQDYYPELKKKGYLPQDFDKNFKIWEGEGGPSGVEGVDPESVMFKNTDSGIQAKAAMMRAFYDESDAYAKKKGYNLTPEQRDYFALAHFNSGSHGYQMMDAYNKAGLLKNNDFISKMPNISIPGVSPKLHQQIYGNIAPRIAAARGLKEEGLFEYGGKMPKYPDGGEVPVYNSPTQLLGDFSAPIPLYDENKPKAPYASKNAEIEAKKQMEAAQKAANRIKLIDNRKVNPVTGQPFSKDKTGTKSISVDPNVIATITKHAKAQGLNPYDALAIAYQESGFGASGTGFGEVKDYYPDQNVSDSFNELDERKMNEEANVLAKALKDKFAYANRLGYAKKGEDYKFQAYNGYGKIIPRNGEKAYYGIPISRENPLDMSKNPAYGKTVLSLRQLLQANPEIAKIVDTTQAFKGAYKYGGTIPKSPKGVPKYTEGTPDPIPGVFQPTGTQVGTNWQTDNNPVPINPNTPIDQQIFKLDNSQQPGNVNNIKPLSQFYDVVNGPNGQQQMVGSGRYVDENGNTTNQAEQQAKADEISNQNRMKAMNIDKNADAAEFIATTGMAAINAYFAKQQAGQLDRTNRRRAIMQQVEASAINPYAEGTGSQAIMEQGGSIHIKPENRGKFNATKKRTGKTTEELTHSKDPLTRKRAIFAQNAAKWHHGENGLSLDGDDPTNQMQILGGGKVEQLSSSDHSNPMFEFKGREHSEGGIGVQYGQNLAEVENNEVGWVDDNGSLNVFGKLKLPGTNQTFKKAAMNIADQEKKVDGKKSKYLNILTNGSDTDPYQESAKSTAKVMFKSLDKQSKQIAEKKEALSSYQNLILAMTDEMSAKMKYGGKMPEMPKLALGDRLEGEDPNTGDPDDPTALIRKAIAQFESGADYGAIGVPVTKGQYKGQRALGKYQIMEDNMRSWGKAATGRDITVAEFIKDPKLQDQVAEYQMRQIAKTHPNPKDIASIWFTGQPTSNNKAMGRKDDNGTSGQQYVNAVMNIYAGYGGNTGDPNEDEFNRVRTALVNQVNSDRTDPALKTRLQSLLSGRYKDYATYNGSSTGNTGANQISAGKLVTTNDILNFTPINNPVGNGTNPVVQTKYGAANREATPFNDKVNIGNGDRVRGAVSPLAIEQIAPELLTMATNRREPVYQLGYQPDLQQTFDVSYQLGRNENQSTFNQLAKVAEQNGNIEALSQLAAQKYQADQQYNMQEVQGNAAQKLQVYNQNINTLNDAKVKNLALIADQQTKQAQAKANTRAEDISAFKSISAKVLQNQLENRTYNAYANLFKHYGFDKNGNVTFNPDKITQRFSAGEAQQFGMMAAQQGAQAIMNGDFSRQFTKVKNSDGSTTTTETLGTNKKIQEEYKTLKNQGFDDNIIGNMLQARYPETISKD